MIPTRPILAVAAAGLILTPALATPDPIPADRLFGVPLNPGNHSLSHDGSRMIVTQFGSSGRAIDVIDTGTGRSHGLTGRGFPLAIWGENSNVIYAWDRTGTVFRERVDRRDRTRPIDIAPLRHWQPVRWPSPQHPFLMVQASKEQNRLYRCDPPPEVGGVAGCAPVADGAPSLDDHFQWLLNRDGRAAARLRLAPTGRFVFEAPDAAGSWKQTLVPDAGTVLTPLGPVRPGGTVWALSNRGRDRVSLVELDVRTAAEKVFYRDERFDLNWAEFSPEGEPLVAYSDPGYQSIHYFDDRVRRGIEAVFGEAGRPSRIAILSAARGGRYLTVAATNDRKVWTEYLVDLEAGSARRLSESKLARLGHPFAPTEPVAFTARDGRRIYGYLTRPLGVDGPAPLLIMLHGGPRARYFWSFDATVQFFASRGYGVLKLNYRGSAGYDRAYLEMARGELGGAVLDDILDAAAWARESGHAARGRIALYGGSFGGFLVLAALARDPHAYWAGIALNSVTDAVAFWKEEWRNAHSRTWWQHWLGSEAFPADMLSRISPLENHAVIAAPVLLIAGLKDDRVAYSHSRRMHERLEAAGKTSQLIAYRSAGHDLSRAPASANIGMHESMFAFLQRHMR